MADSKALSVKEVLVRARARIGTPEKWGKGYGSRGGRDCADSAVASVFPADRRTNDHDETNRLRVAAQDLLREAAGIEPGRVGAFHAWHDDPSTTYEQVLSVFAAAISLAEKQEAIHV